MHLPWKWYEGSVQMSAEASSGWSFILSKVYKEQEQANRIFQELH